MQRGIFNTKVLLLFLPALAGAQSVDTMSVAARCVIFFGPSEAEKDSLSRDESSGLEEVLADYVYYAGICRSFLDSAGIATRETAAPAIFISEKGRAVFRYNRRASGALVGFILLREGRPPEVLTGVHTDEELRILLRKFYGLGGGEPDASPPGHGDSRSPGRGSAHLPSKMR
jgi:hypothetical protein